MDLHYTPKQIPYLLPVCTLVSPSWGPDGTEVETRTSRSRRKVGHISPALCLFLDPLDDSVYLLKKSIKIVFSFDKSFDPWVIRKPSYK